MSKFEPSRDQDIRLEKVYEIASYYGEKFFKNEEIKLQEYQLIKNKD